MTVFTEECLYIRAHLDCVRKEGVVEHMSNLRSDWGGTQKSSIQYPQCGCYGSSEMVKWDVRPRETKAQYSAGDNLYRI